MFNTKPLAVAPIFNEHLSGKIQSKSSLEIYTRRVSFLIYKYILFPRVRFFLNLKNSQSIVKNLYRVFRDNTLKPQGL